MPNYPTLIPKTTPTPETLPGLKVTLPFLQM